jgi:CHAT domain-containing protein
LKEIRREHDQIAQRIRQESPELGELEYPKPLLASDLKQVLDKGTLMLSYSVEKQRTIIFACGTDGSVRTAIVTMSEEELRQKVQTVRDLLKARLPFGIVGRARTDEFRNIARELYRELIGPFEAEIGTSDRILLIPDGPLSLLPWSALIREDSDMTMPGRGWEYLAEWKPIHTVLSATVFSGVRKERRQPKAGKEQPLPPSLEAFGDPILPYRSKDAPESIPALRPPATVPATVRRGARFDPLPWSRDEVQQITLLFSPAARAHLGSDATEENAKSLPRNTRIVHFATHATLDERSPLDSAVVLSLPEKFEEGKENGLLQAWEIFEQVRIDADLVVLSACESGLGKEMGGEGLIGLTRAFQYAGARSVMASLWKISDRTTPELMVRFYKHLKDGLPKDEALRAAQMELIRGPIQVKNDKGEVEEIDASAPYYWAAFQIYGDWQ